jgi:hypothetical protein
VRAAYDDVCHHRISEFQGINSVARVAEHLAIDRAELGSAVELAADLMRKQLDDNSVLLARLLLQAVESGGAEETSLEWMSATLIYLFCGISALYKMPVGPLFRAMSDLANRRLIRARESGDPKVLAAALKMTADVRLFFTLENRDLAWWSNDYNWIGLLSGRIDLTVLHGPTRDDVRPPDARIEMRAAESALLDFLELEIDAEARAPAQVDLARFNAALGEASLVRRESAIAHLVEASRVSRQRVSALQLLDGFNALDDVDRNVAVYDGSLTAELDAWGAAPATQQFRTVAWLAMRLGRHDEAAELTHEFLGLDVSEAPDEERVQALDVAVHCGDHGIVPCRDLDTAVEVRETQRKAAALAGPGQLAFALLHAALHAPRLDVVDEVLQEPRATHPIWRGQLYVLRTYVRARVAVNEVEVRWREPGFQVGRLDLLTKALSLYAELSDARTVRNLLLAMARAVDDQRDTAQAAVELLGSVLGKVLLWVDAIDDEVAALGRVTAFRVRYPQSDPLGTCFHHSQLFKGFQFAAVVRNPGPLAEAIDDRSLDEEANRIAAEQPSGPDASAEAFAHENVDSELLTLFYAVQSEQLTGRTPSERVQNLHILSDRAARRRLYRNRNVADDVRRAAAGIGISAGAHGLMSVEELEGTLDESTVLVDLFDGPTEDRKFCNYAATHRYDGWHADALVGPSDWNMYTILDPHHPGRLVRGPVVGLGLAELRRNLVDSPGTRRPVSRQVAELLEHSPMSGLTQRLQEYRALGCDRLCIWPHATSHYAPLHLMSPDGRPLADDWLITTIPTVACLVPKADRTAGGPPLHDLEVTVLAASSPDGGLHAGYPVVPELGAQATSIAETHAGSRLLEPGSATPEALLDWMPRSRYVHLAAHGSADPFAPSYQTLHFTGHAGSGALTARALMQTDLRNVELVTLSACESALGRFDQFDNQAGLTAALLGSGVTAVVACLWPVRPEPSSEFFVALYEALAQAGPQPDLRAVFRSAQLSTRETYPAYRDWGAFVYIGGW